MLRLRSCLLVTLLLATSLAGASASAAERPRDAATPLKWARSLVGAPATPAADPAARTATIAPSLPGLPSSAIAAMSLTPPQDRAVADLVATVAAATRARREAYASVAPTAILAALADPATADSLATLSRIDRPRLLAAAEAITRTIARTRPVLATLDLAAPTCVERILCIGTDGDDRWTEDVQLLIEPGGNDTYLNNAGGSLSEVAFAAAGGCSLGGGSTGHAAPNLGCTAAPSNVCTYDTANRATGRDDLPVVGAPGHTDPAEQDRDAGSCGNDTRTAMLARGLETLGADADGRSVTVLVDLDGDDRYLAPWAYEDPRFNLVADCYPSDPDRRNTNRDFIQGASLAGIGVLWDDGSGDDHYRARLNSQGSGHVGGVGVLVATGEGDTTFWADRLSQGNGIAAGIGILANTKTGAQTYLLDPPVVYRNEFAPNARDCQQEGRAGQGEGGFGGLGILATLGGTSSVYRAITHVTNEAVPFDPALDATGAPRLVPGTNAQGSGESFPISATGGGLVVGGGLLVDATTGDARTCLAHPRAGMLVGATSSTGEDLSTIGRIDRSCGTFNTASELDPARDLASAIARLAGGAIGVRVVLPR